MKQIRVVMTCDEGYVADSLRALAVCYEDDLDNNKEYESYEWAAKIEEIDV